jgi:hypothetical protein
MRCRFLEFHEVKLPTQIAQRPYFLEFCEAKLRKTKPQSGLVRARDRSGIFVPQGQKLERIARFFAPPCGAKNAPKPASLIMPGY